MSLGLIEGWLRASFNWEHHCYVQKQTVRVPNKIDNLKWVNAASLLAPADRMFFSVYSFNMIEKQKSNVENDARCHLKLFLVICLLTFYNKKKRWEKIKIH